MVEQKIQIKSIFYGWKTVGKEQVLDFAKFLYAGTTTMSGKKTSRLY